MSKTKPLSKFVSRKQNYFFVVHTFEIDNNCAQSSSAGEFHPHALTEPDVTVSHHPARIVQLTVYCPSASAQTDLVAVKQFYSASVLLWFYGT
jgi:hypothetical protein